MAAMMLLSVTMCSERRPLSLFGKLWTGVGTRPTLLVMHMPISNVSFMAMLGHVSSPQLSVWESGTVKSQAMGFHVALGRKVAPSGHLLSFRILQCESKKTCTVIFLQ